MNGTPGGAAPRTIAFLGPAGTHTEGALHLYDPASTGVPETSIAGVFAALASGRVDAGFVPLENMIQGPVTETLDRLLAEQSSIYIADSFVMSIRNAVGILPEVECGAPANRPITAASSHDQALRQCQQTLLKHFPGIQLVPTSSTAAAIDYVRSGKFSNIAVVAPGPTLRHAGFDVLLDDASDVAANKTRFALLRRGNAEAVAAGSASQQSTTEAESFVTSLVVDPGRDRKGILFDILQVISVRHHVNLVTIHSRPDTRGGVVFHLDLAGGLHEERIRRCLDDLRQFSVSSTGKTVEIIVLGSYRFAPFFRMPFRSIGIVGHEGVMGRWFAKFFREAGLEVFGSDRESGLPLEQLIARSDVVLLSVPMSKSQEIAAACISRLRPGQLIVENCSIKECVLPFLAEKAPQGVEVLGIHTMFGGSAESLQGENVIVTRTSRSADLSQALEDLLYKHGAKLQSSSPAEHDRVSASVQSLLQLLLIAYGNVLRDSFGTRDSVDFMSTPNYRLLLQVLGRVTQQTDDLICDLQTLNSQAPHALRQFVAVLTEFAGELEAGSTESLRARLNAARSFMEGSS